MAEQIEWEPLALSQLNLLDKCEIDSEEVTYPITANVFNGVEMALSVILVVADTINDSLGMFLSLLLVFVKFIDTGGNNLLRMREGQPVLWI